jgi:hypothetical protein
VLKRKFAGRCPAPHELLKKLDQNLIKNRAKRGFKGKVFVKLFSKSLRVWAEPTV